MFTEITWAREQFNSRLCYYYYYYYYVIVVLFYSPQTLAKENVLINFKRNYKNDKDISRKFTCLVIYLTQTPNSTKKISTTQQELHITWFPLFKFISTTLLI